LSRIHLSVPHMGGSEEKYVREAFRSNWLSTVGPNLTAFEEEVARLLGRPVVALSSGTAAMHLALRLLGVGPGDEVFCPTFTFVATANPILYLGARPVFLDSDEVSWNLDPNVLEDALAQGNRRGSLPRAVIVVHLYGQSADMDPILGICERYGVPVLEDAAEAMGTLYKGKPAGSMSPASVFSFNGNKIITTTGGGMFCAADAAWVAKARFWSTQARDPGPVYHHSEMGYNYRMSNVLAGIGRGQLEVLADRVRRRREIAFFYRDSFAQLPGISLMPQCAYGLHTNWLSCFRIDSGEFGADREAIIRALEADDIESRPTWKPLHMQPLFAGATRFGGAVAETIFREGICLPSSSSLSPQELERIVSIVRDVGSGVRNSRRLKEIG
jgi:dTDP-4-amino-4,6-dideoxygalactose transaminase